MHAEVTQRQHYNRIAADYEAQYGDPDGLNYREQFLYEPLFVGLDLKGRQVLEALSGSGHATEYLLTHKSARVTGLDISDEAIESFKTRWPGCEAICAPITKSDLPDESFDCVVVVMGLHHLHPHLGEALREIHRLLRKGGVFCFAAPCAGLISLETRTRDSMSYPAYEYWTSSCVVRRFSCFDRRAGRCAD